jgi:hypothetical protein
MKRAGIPDVPNAVDARSAQRQTVRGRAATAARLLRRIECQRLAVVTAVTTLAPDQQHWRAQPTTWSAVDVLEHLVLAEHVVLGDLSCVAARLDHPARRLDRVRRFLVWLLLRAGVRVQVPAVAMQPTGAASVDALCQQWAIQHQALRHAVAALAPAGLERRLFRHPIAGPLTMLHALRLLSAHLGTHLRQLQRLRAAAPDCRDAS